jgi:hypothetical protein
MGSCKSTFLTDVDTTTFIVIHIHEIEVVVQTSEHVEEETQAQDRENVLLLR